VRHIIFQASFFHSKPLLKAKKCGKARQLIYDARELYTELPAVAGSPIKNSSGNDGK